MLAGLSLGKNKFSAVPPQGVATLGDTFRASVFCGQAIDLNGRPGPIRTGDPLLRRQMLYPTELRARAFILSALSEMPASNCYRNALGKLEAYTPRRIGYKGRRSFCKYKSLLVFKVF